MLPPLLWIHLLRLPPLFLEKSFALLEVELINTHVNDWLFDLMVEKIVFVAYSEPPSVSDVVVHTAVYA